MMVRRVGVLFVLSTLVAVVSGCSYLSSRRVARGPEIRDERVVFTFYAPTARRVQLAGNWPENNWARGDGRSGEADVGLMEDNDADGVWELGVELLPGTYQYLFWVDENTWHTDPGNPEEVEGGPMGVCSRIVLHRSDNRLEIE